MLRSNLLNFIIFVGVATSLSSALAQTEQAAIAETPISKLSSPEAVIRYLSFNESFRLQQSGVESTSSSALYGLGFEFRTAQFYFLNQRMVGSFEFQSGTSQVGESGGPITFTKSKLNFTAFKAGLEWIFPNGSKDSAQNFQIGFEPFVLNRQLKVETSVTDPMVTLGPATKVGVLLNLHTHINESLNVHTNVGFLSSLSHVYWSLGLGYSF